MQTKFGGIGEKKENLADAKKHQFWREFNKTEDRKHILVEIKFGREAQNGI